MPILTTLHKDGHIASGYLNDIYLQGNDYNDCLRNIIDTLKLFIKLGFIIHPTKEGPVYTDAYSLDTLSYSVKTEQLICVYTIVFDVNRTIDFCLHATQIPCSD